jgi:predicted nicotinamide N-methyase
MASGPADFDEFEAASTAFIRSHTALVPARLRGDIVLYLATDVTALWQATEDYLERNNMAPPFWAFAWPGSEALAYHISVDPSLVAGRRVLDFAAGSGLAGIACAKAGAVVEAADIDKLSRVAIALNAAANDVSIHVLAGDVVGEDCRWDVILCGDVCYEAPMSAHILPWLRACAQSAVVIIAEPGRSYAPRGGFSEIARVTVPTSLDLEDSEARDVALLVMHHH